MRGCRLALLDQHQLGRSAADVEDQRRPVARLEQLVAAEHRQPRFLLRGDDLQRDAGLALDPVDEIAAVDGAAAGLGRDRARQGDMAAPELVGADRQRLDRPVHRSLGEIAAGRQALAQPDDAREGVEHGEAAVARARDQQPAIVGAEVERAIDVALVAPCGAAVFRLPVPRTGGSAHWRLAAPSSHAHSILDRAGDAARLTWAKFNLNEALDATGVTLGESGRLALTVRGRAFYLPARHSVARSSNGKTTNSDSVNRGSNPRRASIFR